MKRERDVEATLSFQTQSEKKWERKEERKKDRERERELGRERERDVWKQPFLSRHKPHYRLDSCGLSRGHQK